MLAIHHLSFSAGFFFLIGISAAAYSSADSALTALTTSFCIDFLGDSEQNRTSEKTRFKIHLGIALYLYVLIVVFHQFKDQSIISAFIGASGYTYGPLLGLFAFGMCTKMQIRDRWVPWIAAASPTISYLFYLYSERLLWGYQFGYEILILNAALMCAGLWIVRNKKKAEVKPGMEDGS